MLFSLALSGGAARPERADAYLGQSLVENPVTKSLTSAAEKVVKAGKFIPETVVKAGKWGGTVAENNAAEVFTKGGLLPKLSYSALAFTGGWEIGTEICEGAGIEGCIHIYGNEGTGFPKGTPGNWWSEGEWVFQEVKNTLATGTPGYAYVWKFGSGTGLWSAAVEGKGADSPKNCKNYNQPPGFSGEAKGEFIAWSCTGTKGEHESATQYSYYRYAMEGIGFATPFSAPDSPSIPNTSYTASAKWPEELAAQLRTSPEGEKIGERLASQLEGSGVADPYAVYVTIPSCDELTWGACKAALEGKELVPIRETIDWDEVKTDVPAQVLTVTPPAGNKVETGSKVTVKTNPDKSGMPVFIPNPEPNETYEHYAARLNPSLDPKRVNLTDATLDPTLGPNQVVSVSPAPGTSTDPALTTTVTVQTNPDFAPAPGGGGWTPPGLASIDPSPLTGISSPCTAFPFGVLCWLGEGLAQFNTTGVCPHAPVPVSDDADFDLTLCGETSNTVMSYVRPFLLFAWIVGCGFLFAKATRAIGGG